MVSENDSHQTGLRALTCSAPLELYSEDLLGTSPLYTPQPSRVSLARSFVASSK